MQGIFIQSFDCEGRWGVADHLTQTAREQIDGPQLDEVYTQIAGMFDEFGLQATFAFVGAFMLDESMLRSYMPVLQELDERCPGYLNSFLVDAEKGGFGGWAGASCFARLRSARANHEFATHGFSHIPWNWPGFTSDAAESELRALRKIADTLGISIRTMVFPRNAVSHLQSLEQEHFAGYRHNVMWQSRAARLIREFHLWERSDPHTNNARLVAIPGGQFMNVRFGARRVIPANITIARCRHIVDSACRSSGVAHLWCHPENFLGARDGLDVLCEILAHVRRRCDQGDLIVMTQADYCDEVIYGRIAAN